MIMTRGKIGESGELQGYFDKLGVPFTFSGVEETKVMCCVKRGKQKL